jgi:hypothetical protein
MMDILTSLQPWVLLTGLAVDLLAGLYLDVGHTYQPPTLGPLDWPRCGSACRPVS